MKHAYMFEHAGTSYKFPDIPLVTSGLLGKPCLGLLMSLIRAVPAFSICLVVDDASKCSSVLHGERQR